MVKLDNIFPVIRDVLSTSSLTPAVCLAQTAGKGYGCCDFPSGSAAFTSQTTCLCLFSTRSPKCAKTFLLCFSAGSMQPSKSINMHFNKLLTFKSLQTKSPSSFPMAVLALEVRLQHHTDRVIWF